MEQIQQYTKELDIFSLCLIESSNFPILRTKDTGLRHLFPILLLRRFGPRQVTYLMDISFLINERKGSEQVISKILSSSNILFFLSKSISLSDTCCQRLEIQRMMMMIMMILIMSNIIECYMPAFDSLIVLIGEYYCLPFY